MEAVARGEGSASVVLRHRHRFFADAVWRYRLILPWAGLAPPMAPPVSSLDYLYTY